MTSTVNLDVDYVGRMFRALEQADFDTFRSCFTDDAVVWHNDDLIERNMDEVCAILAGFRAESTDVQYEDQRIVGIGDVRFVQHVLAAKLRSGKQFRMPAMMRIALNGAGRISRIEEYYDSRATDCLRDEAGN